MMNNNIYIIGSGAIGKALAVFLKKQNKQVQLVRGSVDNLPNIETEITVVGKDETFAESILTTTFSNLKDINGIVLVTTKTFANEKIAEKLRGLNGHYEIVLLQNGLNIEHPFNDLGKVYRCVLLSTSQVTGENKVSFKTVAASPIGDLDGLNEGLHEVIERINTPQFQFREEASILKFVWNKTVANCVFNTICPLLEIDNGIFHRNLEAKKLAKDIIEECVVLAETQGVLLDTEEILENLLLISQKSDGQLISTYMDILNHRQTEIKSLNLEISRIAQEIGRPELVQKTKFLGQLIELKSKITHLENV
ncbi:hypothetical protein CJ263_01415 [Maribacter cobaltidurans]|uniref:2-dehydropantoate 2-reductase n=2 Tax=Maribacter cobaltidurans TaxID=1178778 RepID=A0A223V0K6_9FLAO|nr:hypothetical protein CJ263_01415 [Maribacter cobaltidurans]GGD72859.1 2-dehydropantoate 2-reductase [Maribacter cobaltidurans]